MLAARALKGGGESAMASRGQLAKRALVKVLLALAAVYGLVVNVSRDSADDAVKAAYSRVVRRAHPDKGRCAARLCTHGGGAQRGRAIRAFAQTCS